MRKTGDSARIKQAMAIAFAVACLPALSACETFFEAEAVRTHPVEGKLVDIGGRRIQIDCQGEGGPTVVFQSGGDMLGSLGWKPVMEKVTAKTRACAYSRAGILWSDPASTKFEPEEVARDLHAALAAAGEKPPYVMVAHSRGGLYNMIFAGLYRDEIAGMVFADSSHPDQEKRFREAGLPTGEYVTPAQEFGLAFRWTGLMRLSPYPADPSISDEVRAFYPKSAQANAREARERSRTMDVAGRYRDLQNWPIVVLARELPEQTQARKRADAHDAYLLSSDGLAAGSDTPESEIVWRQLQADLATWSSRGRLQIVPDSNHAFFFHRPDMIAGAIDEVLAAARVVRRTQPQMNWRSSAE
ncbi:MAG TPA: alpha/beta hydrolase [Hyphomonadaceae bacterium]|nr:alpha/beta hydrolase [Hyphomonadaceae bacterium]HPI47656.1 alpha/beta hydrolase [Hyphomonadaceae bacterium]